MKILHKQCLWCLWQIWSLRQLCLQALQAKMCCNANHDRFLHICHFQAWEYKKRLSAGWVSVVNIKTNQIICFLAFSGCAVQVCLLLHFFCIWKITKIDRQFSGFLRRWWRSPSCFLSAHYVSSSTLATCTGRKRGTISLDGMSFSKKKKITKITCLPFKCFTTNILGFEIWCSAQPFEPFIGLW